MAGHTPQPDLPVATIPSPLPVPVSRVAADPQKEYVSAGQLQWLTGFLRAQPSYIDDATRDFGDDLYERMMNDPQVASAIHTIKHNILVNSPSLPAAVGKEDPQFDRAQKIADFCTRTLKNLDTPLDDVLWNMLDALPYGNKVAEKVYDFGSGDDAGQLVLKKLKVKPRSSVAFVVDAYNNVSGLLGLVPGVAYSVLLQNLFSDPAQVPNFLPRDKFAVLTCRMTDGDPRGRSLLRPAYYAWYMKTTAWPEYLKFLSLYAIPILVGTTAQDDMSQEEAIYPDGRPVLDAEDNPTYLTPQQSLLRNLVGLHNGTAIAVPFGAKIEALDSKGDGGAFLSANDLFDRQIEKAITGQTLATSEAKHDTRAASQTHQDVLGGVVAYGRTLIETMLYRDVLKDCVRLRFGEDAVFLTPWPVMSDVEQQDTTALWTALADLQKSGYLDPSQKVKLDAQVGLPERSAESVEQEIERQNAAPVAASGAGDRPAQPVEGVKADNVNEEPE